MPTVRTGLPQAPLRVLVAPNAFKGSLTAQEAATAMATGVLRAAADARCILRPMADGGDGSLDAFVAAGFTRTPVTTHGPTGAAVSASFASDGSTAVVELASSCGLGLLPSGELAPMTSTTHGLGDAIRAALDTDPSRIIVCLGGSASTDGGTGLLVALGARLAGRGRRRRRAGRRLAAAHRRGRPHPPRRSAARHRHRHRGRCHQPAARTGRSRSGVRPQKGATRDEVAELDAGLRSWADVLARATGRDVASTPGAGAAGGAGAALLAACDASMSPGAALIADLVGLDAALADSDLVVTGEGRLDAQSMLGKGAVLVAARARATGVPTLAVCGAVDLDAPSLRAAGFDAWQDCRSRAAQPAEAITRAGELVADATADAVRGWLTA